MPVPQEQLDAYALRSHERAVAAIDEGRFEREIVPVEVSNPHVGVLVGVDEAPRRDTSMEALAALKPAFRPDGKVTAGNSSRAPASSRSGSRASTRTGCSTAIRKRARRRSGGRG